MYNLDTEQTAWASTIPISKPHKDTIKEKNHRAISDEHSFKNAPLNINQQNTDMHQHDNHHDHIGFILKFRDGKQMQVNKCNEAYKWA